jgi:CRISPR-associated endoribonuclease Cas6
MRLQLTLSPSREIVPFNHLPVLTGALHKWLGPNTEHDGLSLYSFSWLQGAKGQRDGLRFVNGAEWFISALDGDFMMRSVRGILSDPDIRWDMRVDKAEIIPPPLFPDQGEVRFLTASPVFVKRKLEDGSTRHYLYTEPESDTLLTDTLQHKLRAAGLPADGAAVRFDREYPGAKTQKVTYRGIGNMCNVCPVFVTGTKQQLEFAWTVGVGNSSGIGLGSLRISEARESQNSRIKQFRK